MLRENVGTPCKGRVDVIVNGKLKFGAAKFYSHDYLDCGTRYISFRIMPTSDPEVYVDICGSLDDISQFFTEAYTELCKRKDRTFLVVNKKGPVLEGGLTHFYSESQARNKALEKKGRKVVNTKSKKGIELLERTQNYLTYSDKAISHNDDSKFGMEVVSKMKTKQYIILMENDIKPSVLGPFDSDGVRLAEARKLRAEDPEKKNGIYKLDGQGAASVDTFDGNDSLDVQTLSREELILNASSRLYDLDDDSLIRIANQVMDESVSVGKNGKFEVIDGD